MTGRVSENPSGFKCAKQKKAEDKLSGPLGLDFHKLLDVINTMLLCHINDVVQGVYVTQNLHNLSDLLPGDENGAYDKHRVRIE